MMHSVIKYWWSYRYRSPQIISDDLCQREALYAALTLASLAKSEREPTAGSADATSGSTKTTPRQSRLYTDRFPLHRSSIARIRASSTARSASFWHSEKCLDATCSFLQGGTTDWLLKLRKAEGDIEGESSTIDAQPAVLQLR